MAQLICTMTKPDANTPWIIAQAPYAESVCTEDEMNNVIIPARNYNLTLAGYQSSSNVESNSTTLIITYEFDTFDNANTALQYIYRPKQTDQSISYARKELMMKKRLEANVSHTANTIVVA